MLRKYSQTVWLLRKAQFDTGAQKTCLAKRVIDHHNLKPSGKIDIISVSGIEEVNTYVFTLGFILNASQDKVGSSFSADFHWFPPIQGAEIYTHDDDDLGVLIGMDVISAGSLHIEAAGFFSF